MQRPFERFDPPVEANLRKTYRLPPDGSDPPDLRRLLSTLKDALDAHQAARMPPEGGTCR